MIAHGIYPTMITPFTREDTLDWAAIGPMVDWYVREGVHGIFAVCQSSEMFFLSREERLRLARAVVEAAAGRVAVVASGHVADGLQEQIEDIRAMADTGVAAVVLVSNRLAPLDAGDEVFRANAQRILEAVPDVELGIYECPYPYKRLLSLETLAWCAQTGRFSFFKDTCCDAELISQRLRVLEGTGMALFNANSATLGETLAMGCAGFSGVMANFHPALYRALWDRRLERGAVYEDLAALLSVLSGVERGSYPANAKYHMSLTATPMCSRTRSLGLDELPLLQRREMEDLLRVERAAMAQLLP